MRQQQQPASQPATNVVIIAVSFIVVAIFCLFICLFVCLFISFFSVGIDLTKQSKAKTADNLFVIYIIVCISLSQMNMIQSVKAHKLCHCFVRKKLLIGSFKKFDFQN